jgi:hypothetical protein
VIFFLKIERRGRCVLLRYWYGLEYNCSQSIVCRLNMSSMSMRSLMKESLEVPTIKEGLFIILNVCHMVSDVDNMVDYHYC